MSEGKLRQVRRVLDAHGDSLELITVPDAAEAVHARYVQCSLLAAGVPPPPRRKLLVVTDTFAIAGRGLILAPDVALAGGQQTLAVELRRPDGGTTSTEALAQVPFVVPLSATQLPSRGHVLTLSLDKADVPLGTEVWFEASKKPRN